MTLRPPARQWLSACMLGAALSTSSTAAFAADHSGDTAPVASARPAFAGKRVGDQALAAQRGGTEVSNDAALQAVVSNNQAVNVTTGSNLITGGALAGAAGVPVVIQNSGNNVVVQSSTIINVQLK